MLEWSIYRNTGWGVPHKTIETAQSTTGCRKVCSETVIYEVGAIILWKKMSVKMSFYIQNLKKAIHVVTETCCSWHLCAWGRVSGCDMCDLPLFESAIDAKAYIGISERGICYHKGNFFYFKKDLGYFYRTTPGLILQCSQMSDSVCLTSLSSTENIWWIIKENLATMTPVCAAA